MVVGRRHLCIVQEHQPLAAMDPDVIVEVIQFRAHRLRQAVEPVVEAILDLLDTAGLPAGRGKASDGMEQAAGREGSSTPASPFTFPEGPGI
jgi:hypothetical protein